MSTTTLTIEEAARAAWEVLRTHPETSIALDTLDRACLQAGLDPANERDRSLIVHAIDRLIWEYMRELGMAVTETYPGPWL